MDNQLDKEEERELKKIFDKREHEIKLERIRNPSPEDEKLRKQGMLNTIVVDPYDSKTIVEFIGDVEEEEQNHKIIRILTLIYLNYGEFEMDRVIDFISGKYAKRKIILQNLVKQIKKKEEREQKKKKRYYVGSKIKPLDIESVTVDELKDEVMTFLALKKDREATESIMRYVLDTEHIYTIRDDENSEMWIYKGGIYIPQAKTYIKEVCKEILGMAFTPHRCNEVIAKIEVMTYIEQTEFFIERNVNRIAVENGIFDLTEKKLLPFSSEEVFFNKLPVPYNESADCPLIKKHLKDVLENEDDVPILQELFGYLLYRNHSIEKAFMFCGSGRNGKGKTLELMKRFIGAENCCNIPLQQIDRDTFALGEFHNKLANLGGDISSKSLEETGTFKNLTGRDLLSAARKFKIRVHFVNFSKQIFCANELPRTYDTTPAFFNRWVLLNFPFTFISEKELNMMNNPENNGYKLADKNQVDKITNKEELSGLLNWAIKGLERLLKQGDFSYSKTIIEVKKRWMRMSDSVAAFIMDKIEESWGNDILKKDFRREYSLYCKEHKLKMVSDKSMKSTLALSLGIGDDRISVDGKQQSVWQGIKFKIEEEYIN